MPGWRYLNLDSTCRSAARLRHLVRHDHAGPVPDVRTAAELRIPGAGPHGEFPLEPGFLIASVATARYLSLRRPHAGKRTRYLWVLVWLGWFLLFEPSTTGRAQASTATGNMATVAHAAVAGRRCDLRVPVGVLEYVGVYEWIYVFRMAGV